MKKFLIRILIFSLLFFIYDKIYFIFLELSPSLEEDDRLEKVVRGEMNKDILIFGSSRGARNIIASQIEDSLGRSTFNLSYPGSDITFHEYLLRSLIECNKKPSTVILAVDDPSQLTPNETIRFRLDRMYPLSLYNSINNELIRRGEKSQMSRFLVLARINKSNLVLNQKHFTGLDSLWDHGSMPINSTQENNFIFDHSDTTYDVTAEVPEKLEAFIRFIDHCKVNQIKLYLAFSPNFKNLNMKVVDRIRQLAGQNATIFLYNQKEPAYHDAYYFNDKSHLRLPGARIFTNELIRELKKGR